MYLQPLYNIQVYKNLFTHSIVGGHLGCFWFGPIINTTTVNVLVHTSRCTCVCISWIKILGSEVMYMFNFIGCHIILQKDSTSLQSLPTSSVQHLILSGFSFSSNLIGMYPIVVLICTSLITKGGAPPCLLIT